MPSDCPRCRKPLIEVTFRGQPVQSCTACTGLLFPQRAVIPVLEGLASELAKEIDINQAPEAVPDKGRGLACPRCSRALEHSGYMGTKTVMVDSCLTCFLIWVDAEGLGTMSLMFARASERREEYQRLLRKTAVDFGHNLRAQRVASLAFRAVTLLSI